ncbi:MAG TPA: hypothetical protein VEO00_01885 [Actinomycetota bacterium]|nr:hypothetical protein [Actinomycetota bacterium]
MSRRAAILLSLLVALTAGGNAAADTAVGAQGQTFRISVPLSVDGADQAAVLKTLNGVAAQIASRRSHQCFSVKPRFKAGGGDAHQLTVVPQRAGQFVRAVPGGHADPYAGERSLSIGARALEDPAAVRILAAFFLKGEALGYDASVAALAVDLLARAASEAQVPDCAWTGTLEITDVYDRFHLTVTSTLSFSFTVSPSGRVRGTVQPSTRSATVSESDVGSCSGSGITMFEVRLEGAADAAGLTLTFSSHGEEPEFTVSCSGGSITFSGDYIKAPFTLTFDRTLPVGLAERPGAARTMRGTRSGSAYTVTVTITRA